MELTKDDLKKIIQQTRESALIMFNAVSVMGNLICTDDELLSRRQLSAVRELWFVAMDTGLIASGSAADAARLFDGDTVERAEDETFDDLQDEINKAHSRLAVIRATTPELADPDSTTFIYEPDKVQD